MSIFQRAILSILLGYTCAAQAGPIEHTLGTGWNWNTGALGVMFDVYVKEDLTLTGVSFNFNGCAGASQSAAMFYKSGTNVGYEETPSAWNSLGTQILSCDGYLNPSSTYDTGSLSFAAGNTYALYLTGVSRGILANYSSAFNLGDVFLSSDELDAQMGYGMYGGSYSPWDSYGVAYRPEIELHYTTTAPVPEPPMLLLLLIAVMGLYPQHQRRLRGNYSLTKPVAGV